MNSHFSLGNLLYVAEYSFLASSRVLQLFGQVEHCSVITAEQTSTRTRQQILVETVRYV